MTSQDAATQGLRLDRHIAAYVGGTGDRSQWKAAQPAGAGSQDPRTTSLMGRGCTAHAPSSLAKSHPFPSSPMVTVTHRSPAAQRHGMERARKKPPASSHDLTTGTFIHFFTYSGAKDQTQGLAPGSQSPTWCLIQKLILSRVWWSTPVMLALGRLRREGFCEFQASLGYAVLSQKNKTKRKVNLVPA